MTNHQCESECVLIEGRLSADGNTVTVAAGVELSASSVDIVAEMPRERPGNHAVMLYFATPEDREDFAATFRDAYPDGCTVGF